MTWTNTPEQQRVVDQIKATDGDRPPTRKRSRSEKSNREYSNLGELAAKWCHDDPSATFAAAALRFGIARTTVHGYFKTLYPNEPTKGRW